MLMWSSGVWLLLLCQQKQHCVFMLKSREPQSVGAGNDRAPFKFKLPQPRSNLVLMLSLLCLSSRQEPDAMWLRRLPRL